MSTEGDVMEGVPDGRPLDRRPSATSSTSRGQSALSTPQRSQRRPSRTQQPQEITKVRLCVLGFFHANHYEGPYGKHIAVIIHSGNAVLILGVLLSAIAFLIEQPSGPIDGVRVFAIVILTLGITTTISTATVYARAHQNAITGENGRVNLHSRDILIQIALGFTVVMILMGAVLLPLSFSMSSRQVLFEYFKVVGFAYVGLGLISFIIITMYSKFSHKNRSSPNRGSNSTRNSTRTPRRQRSRANSGIPEIRVESDTASDTGAGSDISDIPNSARRTSVVTPSIIICPPFPPPYREVDPHPGAACSDAGSTVNTISAAHSMVTLLQYAYADELQQETVQTPPPPYSEAVSLPNTPLPQELAECIAYWDSMQNRRAARGYDNETGVNALER